MKLLFLPCRISLNLYIWRLWPERVSCDEALKKCIVPSKWNPFQPFCHNYCILWTVQKLDSGQTLFVGNDSPVTFEARKSFGKAHYKFDPKGTEIGMKGGENKWDFLWAVKVPAHIKILQHLTDISALTLGGLANTSSCQGRTFWDLVLTSQDCICFMTRGGMYSEIESEHESSSDGRARGIFQGYISPYIPT